MAISIIESLRIDRYEFEVFVNNFNFVGIQSSEKNTTKDDAEKSKVYQSFIIFSLNFSIFNVIFADEQITRYIIFRYIKNAISFDFYNCYDIYEI